MSRKVAVWAKPGARVARVVPLEGEGRLLVAVRERAAAGEANRAIEAAVAEYFGVPRSQVHVISGARSRQKLVQVG